ncbi:MAG: L-serine ammonia-lyase, iron-sulfur-dependent, subunit alpha [Candidatus Aminicenantes bacterium]
MGFVSILNDVMGPVMRGPSSSHTAGSYRIGRMARSLFGECPSSVTFQFDPEGSYSKVFREQGADLAFISGILNWSITDERFLQAREWAEKEGTRFIFDVMPLEGADHPNTVHISMVSRSGRTLKAVAKSVGGGMVAFTRIGDYAVDLKGKAYEYIVLADEKEAPQVIDGFVSDQSAIEPPICHSYKSKKLCQFRAPSPLSPKKWAYLNNLPGVIQSWSVDPVFSVQKGESLFSSAQEILNIARDKGCSLGRVGLLYESEILGMSEADVLKAMEKRLDIMEGSLLQGEKEESIHMQLLQPSAPEVLRAVSAGRVAVGGIHARAAGRAMAVCHVNNSMGVVCAAPTGGSSGVIPAVIASMAEEYNLKKSQSVFGLLAASAIGIVIAKRATFAAEIAGCQVEIGAAGAMAAAAVVEMTGGNAQQAIDAASIALQNTMGSVCDLVQGICELPCHTRNATAASSAFVCADLILGGYHNPIPLDETVDAVLRVGEMLPSELRCTALGGIATAPSALALPRLRKF